MLNDPMKQFNDGTYRRPDGNAPKSRFLLLLGLCFILVGGFIFSDAVGELKPLNPPMETQGIIKSKGRVVGTGGIGRLTKLEIRYYYPIGANPENQNVYNGFNVSSWLYYNNVEVGDIVTVKYDPSAKDVRKRSYVKGSRPFIMVGIYILIGFFIIVVGLSFCFIFLQAKTAPIKTSFWDS